MSWISPTFSDFGDVQCLSQPPNKKSKASSSQRPESPVILEPPVSSCNWLEKYKPKNIDDLAVNVKKINEIKAWLEQSCKAINPSKFLIVTGPSGCGKATTLQLVSKSLGFKILEWITPLDRPTEETEYPTKQAFSKSAAKQFEEFLFRSSRYGSCLVSSSARKLVLVKDFPNAFIHNPSSFHDILENFHEKCKSPVVFICGDENLLRKLFPATIKVNLQISTISLNGVTDQRMFRVLKNLLGKESKVNKNIKVLPDQALHTVCSICHGDVRSAISKLYFCTIKSDYDVDQLKSTELSKKRKVADKNVPTDKDTRLDFFHGIGRVLYPKTVDNQKELKFVHSTQTIVESFLSEPNSFISQLHENYPDKLSNVYDLSFAAKRLSQSDILLSRWQEKDVFSTYAMSVAVQGVMVSNKVPKKGRFEAFRKSQTARTEMDCKAIELEGKAIFSDLRILDYECLVDILPYYMYLIPDLDTGQMEYLRRTCQFK